MVTVHEDKLLGCLWKSAGLVHRKHCHTGPFCCCLEVYAAMFACSRSKKSHPGKVCPFRKEVMTFKCKNQTCCDGRSGSVEMTMAFSPGDKTINVNGHFIRGKGGMYRLMKGTMLTAASPQQHFRLTLLSYKQNLLPLPSALTLKILARTQGTAISVQAMSSNRNTRFGCREKVSNIPHTLCQRSLCTQHYPISPASTYCCSLQAYSWFFLQKFWSFMRN